MNNEDMNGKTTLEQLVENLRANGWEIKLGDKNKLVSVEQGSAVHCVDGRKGDKPDLMRGPKIQGGVLGVAALMFKDRKSVGEEELRAAVTKIKELGFLPGVHGDDHNNELGCGFGKLWRQGELSGLPRLDVNLEQARKVVEEQGGVYVELVGEHEEQVVRVNLMAGKTLVPEEDGFKLDAWFAEKAGIDTIALLENAVETVEKLGGPKVIEIFK